MRLALAVLVLLAAPPVLAQPGSGDGSVVDIRSAQVPPIVVVDHAFPVAIEIENKASETKPVNLFSFLYVHEEGRTCGTQTDSRFAGPVSRGAGNLNLAPRSRITFPSAGATPWYHEVNASQTKGPGKYQLCVVAYDPKAAQGLIPFDLMMRPVELRLANGLPQSDFSWAPDVGNVTTEFRFVADVGDDPEGDALRFDWEFGHLSPAGRARGEGAIVTHVFFHLSSQPRTYLVNLTVSDGFDSVVVRKQLVVQPEGVPAPQRYEPPDGDGSWWAALPGPGAAALILLSLGLARRARSR